MTPEAQRIAIAEACGWKDIRMSERWECSDDPGCPQDLCGVLSDPRMREHLPDYLNDLNAMHEAEKVLGVKLEDYWEELSYICERDFKAGVRRLNRDRASATAAQRAEAFLRTIGKWEK